MTGCKFYPQTEHFFMVWEPKCRKRKCKCSMRPTRVQPHYSCFFGFYFIFCFQAVKSPWTKPRYYYYYYFVFNLQNRQKLIRAQKMNLKKRRALNKMTLYFYGSVNKLLNSRFAESFGAIYLLHLHTFVYFVESRFRSVYFPVKDELKLLIDSDRHVTHPVFQWFY